MAVGTAQIEDANKQVIRKAFDEWAAGTGGIWGLLDQDLTWTVIGTGPISGRYHSRQDFLDQVITQIDRRLSDPLSPTVRGIYADGDMVIVRFDAAGTARDGSPTATASPGTCGWSRGRSSRGPPSSTPWRSTTSGSASPRAHGPG